MSRSDGTEALRHANPGIRAGFAQFVEETVDSVRGEVATAIASHEELPAGGRRHARSRRRIVRLSAAGAAFGATFVGAAFLLVGSPGSGPGVENATAAVKSAATVTAHAAEASGTVVVRVTRGDDVWAGTTIRWYGGNLEVSGDASRWPGRLGSKLLLVDGMLYGRDERDGGWAVLGGPDSIDPDSGTTPAEYLAAIREDTGGATLHRIVDHMAGLRSSELDDGSTVYSGTVAAGLIARETGFKEGRAIRVLPFGFVAHDEPADPASPLGTRVTVGVDGIVREIAVHWGGPGPAWTYTVRYSSLGTTASLVAPANPRPLRDRVRLQPPATAEGP